MQLFIGTYSLPIAGVQAEGKGIYSLSFDLELGTFSQVKLLAECANPSALAMSPDGTLLFATREVFADNNPALISFKIGKTGLLNALSNLPIIGELPCHLAYDRVHNRIASAQYWTGDVAIAKLNKGVLQPPTYHRRIGHGPNAKRQESPHAHCVAFSDQGHVLHLVDLGTDSVVSHLLDAQGHAKDTAILRVTKGSGPRHLAINRAATHAWVFCELNESLIALERDGLGWEVSNIQSGFDAPLGEDGSGAAIRLSPDEKHIYISGRRQSQIAAFRCDGSPIGIFECGGTCPREFIITPNGDWVICANQDSNSLTCLRRDSKSGVLTLTDNTYVIQSPVALIIK